MPEVDLTTDRAHPARIYDYLLGGKTHYLADREAGDELLGVMPALRTTARHLRQRRRRRGAPDHRDLSEGRDLGVGAHP